MQVRARFLKLMRVRGGTGQKNLNLCRTLIAFSISLNSTVTQGFNVIITAIWIAKLFQWHHKFKVMWIITHHCGLIIGCAIDKIVI